MRSAADMLIPERYVGARFDSYKARTPSQRGALDAAQLLSASFSSDDQAEDIDGLALLGPPGVGKSHLLAAVCNAVADRLLPDYRAKLEEVERSGDPYARVPRAPTLPLWCNVPTLVVDMRAEMDAPEKPAATWARELRGHDSLVVLDDLGRERMSDWTGELVYAIVNSRYEAVLPTAISSNLSPDELRDSGYWPAISRLAEDGRLVVIDAPDHRLA